MLEVSYAGSHGANLYNFYNGNQAVPDPTFSPLLQTLPIPAAAPRRPAKMCDDSVFPPSCNEVFDTAIDLLRTDGFSNYNSLQVRLEASHGLQFEASYTFSRFGRRIERCPQFLNNGDFRDRQYPYLNTAIPISTFGIAWWSVMFINSLFGSGKASEQCHRPEKPSHRELAVRRHHYCFHRQLVHDYRRGHQCLLQ